MAPRKKRCLHFAALLCAALTVSAQIAAVSGISAHAAAPAAQAAASPDLSPSAVYAAMIALKTQYPEGTPYTNDNYYAWKGGIFSGGYGCAGFAFMLSDAAFGNLPARQLDTFDQVRPGDILRINNNTHFVIILEVTDTGVVVAEGNYGGQVHWGRTFTNEQVFGSLTDYMLTRYPEQTDFLTGDPDNSGDIAVEDAQITLQAYTDYLAKKGYGLSDAEFKAADVDADNTITIEDVQYILSYYTENTLGKKNLSWSKIING
ncbi:MAG: hypothetical protein IJ060_06925 [Oscillospiraceae bacterium]|nr:hypothetical protein [Oscillospiraceae bacterium]